MNGATRATRHRWVGTTLLRERSLQFEKGDREVALGAEVSCESDLMEAESVLKRRAFHEAGHCVVGFYRLGLVSLRSTVVPTDDGQTLGRTDWPYAESPQLAPFIADAGRRLRPIGLVAADEQAARDLIALHVAGEVVAKRLTGVAMPDLARDDLVKAMSLARYIDLRDPESIIEQICREVDADISEPATWQVIERIAEALLAGSTLERAELARLLAGA